jgi:DNA polymerase V
MRPIGLVDCNNFYASCERVFQPELRGRPVVVLSNNDGCVIARSNEAKTLGIEMGAPFHLHKAFFEKNSVVVRSSNYALYGDMSARVVDVLRRFSPDVQVYSIDEAFLDFAGFGNRLEAHARELRATVLRWTGIPVSVGIAPTKTLAKAANRMAKKITDAGGVVLLMDEVSQREALSSMALTDVWGIAGRLAKRLEGLGIANPLDLRAASPDLIRQRLSVVVERTARELAGKPCLSFEENPAPAKSIMVSRSFGRAVTSLDELEEAVATYAARASEKLRRKGLVAAQVTVFVETNRFRPQDPQRNCSQLVELSVPSADVRRVTRAAVAGVRALYAPGYRYKKAGVMLLELTSAGAGYQTDLWGRADTPKSLALMATLDRINKTMGQGTLALASTGVEPGWRVRAERRSQSYTTRWGELVRVGD